MSAFEEFAALARAKGAEVRDCGDGHWQVIGPVTVNYYPFAQRGGTIYVNGMSRAIERGGFDAAIAAAFRPPVRVRLEPRLNRKAAGRERQRMLGIDARCHWCRCTLTPRTATLDHVVPLSRCGTNRPDNLVLACRACNERRGNSMPELSDGREG